MKGGKKGKLSLVIVPWNSWFSRNSIQPIKEAFLLCFWASNVTCVSKMEMDLGRLTQMWKIADLKYVGKVRLAELSCWSLFSLLYLQTQS